MSADPTSVAASVLLSQTNELLAKLTRLKNNAELYTKVRLLKVKLDTLKQNYNALKNSRCDEQCQNLNEMKNPNSVDEYLNQLSSSYKRSVEPSAPPLADLEADESNVNDSNAIVYQYASAPLEDE